MESLLLLFTSHRARQWKENLSASGAGKEGSAWWPGNHILLRRIDMIAVYICIHESCLLFGSDGSCLFSMSHISCF